MKAKTLLTSLAVALVASLGCSKDDKGPADETAGKSVDQSGPTAPDTDVDADESKLDEARARWVKEKREALETIESTQAEIERELEAAGDEISSETRETLAELEAQRQRLAAELDQAEERSGAQWDQFKRDVEMTAERLEQGYNGLLEDMKSD